MWMKGLDNISSLFQYLHFHETFFSPKQQQQFVSICFYVVETLVYTNCFEKGLISIYITTFLPRTDEWSNSYVPDWGDGLVDKWAMGYEKPKELLFP